MIIYLLETEPEEEVYFRAELPGHDLRFVGAAAEVGDDAEIVCGIATAALDASFRAAHPRLRCIAVRGSGANDMDLPDYAAHDIVVCAARSFADETAAEHTFALILALSRRLREVMEQPKEKRPFSYGAARGMDLSGKTLGIIGLGLIGQRVAELAHAFRMRIVAFDPEGRPPDAAHVDAQWLPLEELLAASDIITLHTRLLPATRHLLNRNTLALCRRGVLIVNTARGSLIDTGALDEALESGQVGGAGLDVLEEERVLRASASRIITAEIVERLQTDPAPTSSDAPHATPEPGRVTGLHQLMLSDSLLARKNVVFTPTVAFQSVEAAARLNIATVENIRAFIAGEPLAPAHGE